MPELPEVETIRHQLDDELPGKKISKIEIRLPKMVKGPVSTFKKNAVGAKILHIKRRAKILIWELSTGVSMLVHLKMTGQLVYKKGDSIKSGGHPIKDGYKDLPNKFSHIIIYFSGKSILFFNDIRQFGYVKMIKTDQLENYFLKLKIGLEIFNPDLTQSKFQDMLKNRHRSRIKQILMDQNFIAGVGNIYAIEACYLAGIKPMRRVGSLRKTETANLYKYLVQILKTAIKKQGTSSNTYIDAYGDPGHYASLLKIYGGKGEKCLKCRSIIKSLKIGSRSSAYCPQCQK